MSDPNDPKRPTSGPGRAGSAGSIGKELGSDLDFEADALLDSLMFDDSALSTSPPTPVKPVKLHEPAMREYSEDDVTVVGRTDDLFPGAGLDDGTTGLEDLAGSDIDELLSSMPAPPLEASATQGTPSSEPPPRLPDIPAPPRLPAVPRPVPRAASQVPRAASLVPRPALEATTKPPAINPAGPPPRQPFPPAMSPRAPLTGPSARDSSAKLAPPRPRLTTPTSSAPPPPLHELEEDEEERTRIYVSHNPPSVPPPPSAEGPFLPDPFLPPPAPRSESSDPRSTMPTLQQIDPASRLPTLSVPGPIDPIEMPSIPGPHSLPATSVRDGELELFPETPAQSFGTAELDELNEPSEQTELHTLSPIPERPSTAPSIWPDERPARDHLSGQREAFVTRAEWLEREARAASDPHAKVRALIVASELWALLGELPHAREIAAEAGAIPRAQSMAARQVRALAAAEGDFKAVAPALEMEIRGAATVEARVHAAYLSAEVHRLALHDDATAKKKLDLAVRAQQEDPRAHVAKLTDLLGKSSAPARVRFPESEQLAELARASEELLRMRGAPAPAGTPALQGPRAAFDDARRALSAGDREKAADALDKLASIEGLSRACAWLSACLLGADPKTRARSISGLSELAAHSGSRLARRALVTRALEQGDADGVRAAVSGPQGEQTFSATDRLALAALTGLGAADLETTVWEVAGDPELRPLAAAFVAAASSGLDVRTGNEASRAEQRLGQTLATPPAELLAGTAALGYLQADANAFEATHPGSPLARLLSLEFARVARAKGQVALALGEWPRLTDDPEAARDQQLAAALVHELAGEQSSAAAAYRRALELEPSCEAAIRALSATAPEGTAELLLVLSERLEPSARTALAVLEAALRQGSAQPELYDALIERARLADPELSLSYRLAEMSARRRGDSEALLAALRARREAADDPIERSLDLVREALLVAETDLSLAERLLDEACKNRPGDLALRELSERMVPTEDAERAAWREALGETSEGALRVRLFAEAALERARSGEHETAARDAFLAADS
ncbi:MAG TPA: hypothetical protein VGF76_26610, partial [Polyangiaceae bacterium]